MAGFWRGVILVTQELGPNHHRGRGLKGTVQLVAVIKLSCSVFVCSPFAPVCAFEEKSPLQRNALHPLHVEAARGRAQPLAVVSSLAEAAARGLCIMDEWLHREGEAVSPARVPSSPVSPLQT